MNFPLCGLYQRPRPYRLLCYTHLTDILMRHDGGTSTEPNPPLPTTNLHKRAPARKQGELGELDAQAGFSAQPRPARTATSGGDEPGDGDDGNRGGDAHAGRGGGSSGSPAAAGGGGGAAAPQGQGGNDGAAGREAGGGGQWESISSISGRTGSLTDVMAHELVVDSLVRLALVTEGETAHEVMSVLEHERGRARVRERLGRGAIGPMEEAVAKVGTVWYAQVV